MKATAGSFAAVLVLAFGAVAQEEAPEKAPAPAAPKHENKVSAEAKACIEAMGKAMYRAVPAGLQRLRGTMVSTETSHGTSTTEAVTVDFRAPADLIVKDVPRDPPNLKGPEAAESNLVQFARNILRESFGLDPFLADLQGGEYDAEVAAEGDVKVLVLKGWHEGELVSTTRYRLDAAGLPASAKGTEGSGGDVVNVAETFEYAREGEKFLLVRHVKKFVDVGMLGPVDIANSYTDAGGLKILTTMEMKVPMGGPVSTRWKDLEVNGKKVDLPGEKPEAKDETAPGEKKAPVPKDKDGK